MIHDFAVTHVYRAQNPSAAERLAIVAVGGYGRGTLAPGSDIDLLFLLPYKQTAWGESVVEYVLYTLWDLGFKVGHATRSVDECIRLSKSDATIETSILEARFIWGDQALFEELIERFEADVMAGGAEEFIATKLAERDRRHMRAGESRYLVEPDVKDGKGGMRDLHTLFWIAKFCYRTQHGGDLVKAGVFTRSEFNKFRKCEDFLWGVRCHLHFLTGRAEDRLSFDHAARYGAPARLHRARRAQACRALHEALFPGRQGCRRSDPHLLCRARGTGDDARPVMSRVLRRLRGGQEEDHQGIDAISPCSPAASTSPTTTCSTAIRST